MGAMHFSPMCLMTRRPRICTALISGAGPRAFSAWRLWLTRLTLRVDICVSS